MAKKFQVQLTSAPQKLILKAQEYAKTSGIDFDGDENRGTFGVFGVKGQYVITGETVDIDILDKPFLVPWAIVETQVKDFFS